MLKNIAFIGYIMCILTSKKVQFIGYLCTTFLQTLPVSSLDKSENHACDAYSCVGLTYCKYTVLKSLIRVLRRFNWRKHFFVESFAHVINLTIPFKVLLHVNAQQFNTISLIDD